MISRRHIISSQPTAGADQHQRRQQQQGDHSVPTTTTTTTTPQTAPSGSSSSSSAASKPSGARQQQAGTRQLNQKHQQASSQQHRANTKIMASRSSKTAPTTGASSHKKEFQQRAAPQQATNGKTTTTNSDDYLMSSSSNHQYEDYVIDERSWRQQQQQHQQQQAGLHNSSFSHSNQQQDNTNMNEPFRQHFDPYSIYSDEEDVWCSEERLFEDHLEEIYNKWPLLDDDIWCKLIIMERNRRIGKAYARVPIVTIDGSHELSYDGYKLALNGFDNPDRDDETEECRKRIGKGIRIKMDNFGNILIKRMSKAGVYVKEWINPAPVASGGSSNSTNGSSGAGVGRSMPSRQQLIKAASMAGSSHHAHHHHQMSSLMNHNGTPSSSSGGSSMDSPNDSAICDEVITIGGRLELDKIYVMFDIKKFQANISQELCRPYPDRRKLEQQCFSIVGLTRDSEDILNLPCWLMVINIVAIEMLNERLPLLDDDPHGLTGFPDTRRLHRPQQAPSFVSIFDNQASCGNGGGAGASAGGSGSNHRNYKDPQHHHHNQHSQKLSKEEDPYSLPANASSSDVRSSINDYGTTSVPKSMSNYIESTQQGQPQAPPNHSSRYYGARKNLYPASSQRNGLDLANNNNSNGQQDERMMQGAHQGKSNYYIYGPTSKPPARGSRYNSNNGERYNNSSSIYSPGHMLVPHSGGDHSVPPKLPPRDFVGKRGQRSKSSSNLNYDDGMMSKYDDQSENIYSTGLTMGPPTTTGGQQHNNNSNQLGAVDEKTPASAAEAMQSSSSKTGQRKPKRNRFLESLKAPLELAKSGRSSSVLGVPGSMGSAQSEQQLGVMTTLADGSKSKPAKTKTSGTGGLSKAKNLRSFLGVGGGKSKSSASDDSNYVHLDDGPLQQQQQQQKLKKGSGSKLKRQDSGEADSVVDSNEEIDKSGGHQHQMVTTTTNLSASPTASYNDLDIPTPDYETDENIYALENGCNSYQVTNGHVKSAKTKQQGKTGTNARTRRYSSSNNNINNNNNNNINEPEINHRKKAPKDDLYYSGFRAHVPQHHHHHQLQHGSSTMARASEQMSCLSGPRGGGGCEDPVSAANNRYLMRTSRMLAAKMSSGGRDVIYGSTLGLQQQQQPSLTGSRYRSASMQRYYPASRSNMRLASSNQMYGAVDLENSYALSAGGPLDDPLDHDVHYGVTTASSCIGGAAGRRRSISKLLPKPGRGFVASGGSSNQQDIGRSSSGIYGINSGSSSSEYADWQPQVRKVNSSGYLNSIFKSHQLNKLTGSSGGASGPPVPAANSTQMEPTLNNNNNTNSNSSGGNNSSAKANAHGYNNNNNLNETTSKTRNYASRTLKSTQVMSQEPSSAPNVASANKKSSVINTGPDYRSYDSSNDSDPSYTNSSDGLDIYDQIGANHTRLNNHTSHHLHHKQHLNSHNQFLEHNLAQVHIGEWENMYDR